MAITIGRASFEELELSRWPWDEEVSSDIYADRDIWPKISVITPSFNQGRFIEETIRSVLLQNYPNLEYIIVDGGSTDNTLEIIKKYESRISWWVSEKDNGQADAINKGIKKSTGQIVNWLNSDDYLLPRALYHIGNYSWEKSIGALVGRGYKINLQKEIIYAPYPQRLGYKAFIHWMQENNFMQPACFFSRESWNQCGPLDEDLNFCMDVDLWLKIARKYDFRHLDEDIAFAYTHEGAKTTAESFNCRLETAFLIYKNGYKTLSINEVKKGFDRRLGKQDKSGSLFFRLSNKVKDFFKRQW